MIADRYRPAQLLCAAALLSMGVAGCHDSSGTQDTVVATSSVSGTATAVVGGSKSVTVTFASSDSLVTTHLTVTSGLSSKPAGWSGPASFSCAEVSTGSGCVLTLTYTPAAAGSGTLTLGYGYSNNAGAAKTGTLAIAFAATAHNTVAATAAPTGQINAVVGASQALSLTFTTDDGNPATALTLTSDLATLPAGWSSTDPSFACAAVSTGSGCLLPLAYKPTAAASGTLTLNYRYTDDAGTVQTGTVSVPYAATANMPSGNNVVGTAAPAGQITAVTGASQAVAVTFTTDDHNAATGFSVTSGLSTLPSGWSATGSSLACASVSTGNGCQLNLTYAPTVATTGTVTLGFGYHDSAGMAKTGTLNILYAATAHNNVTGTAAPTGQINAVIGAGNQPVSVTFTTDNATATALTLTTALNSLPSGWTSTATSFTCGSVSAAGSSCQLPLNYAPSVVGGGTLTLNYTYTNDAGVASSGTVSIPYAATANDHITAAVSPSGTVSVSTNQTQAVTVTFTTDDGNIATGLAIANAGSGGIGSLPAGWTVTGGAGSFACSSISTGTSCQLSLTYAPTAVATGTVSLGYSYVNNSGTTNTGTVSIPYAAAVQYVYVAQYGSGVSVCAGGATLSGCTSTAGSAGNDATGIAFYGSYAYIAQFGSSVDMCAVAGDGTLSSCTSTGSNFTDVTQLTVQGAYLYGANANNPGRVTYCAINPADGSLSNCAVTAANTSTNGTDAIAVGPNYAYVGGGSSPYVCTVGGDGSLTNCAATSGSAPRNMALSNGYVYMAGATGTVESCAINGDGTLSNCNAYTVVAGQTTVAVAVAGSTAYVGVTNYSTEHIYACSISAGALSNCTLSDGGGAYSNVWAITAD